MICGESAFMGRICGVPIVVFQGEESNIIAQSNIEFQQKPTKENIIEGIC